MDYTDSAYDDAVRYSQTDDRVGKHDFMITDIEDDFWDSGDPRRKVRGVLLTAGSAKTDFTWSPPPPPEVMKAEYNSWDAKKKKAVGSSIQMARKLKEHYGKGPDELAVNDVIRVQTAKNRDGFIRVIAVLPKAESTNAAASSMDSVPF